MSYALFCLMREKLETYFYTIAILGVGLASGIVMGFSPTIYASADRPYIYLYFILMGGLSFLYQTDARADQKRSAGTGLKYVCSNIGIVLYG